MTNRIFGFTPQKNTIDSAMEAKNFIEKVLESRGVVIMTSLDVKGAFDAASWQSDKIKRVVLPMYDNGACC